MCFLYFYIRNPSIYILKYIHFIYFRWLILKWVFKQVTCFLVCSFDLSFCHVWHICTHLPWGSWCIWCGLESRFVKLADTITFTGLVLCFVFSQRDRLVKHGSITLHRISHLSWNQIYIHFSNTLRFVSFIYLYWSGLPTTLPW